MPAAATPLEKAYYTQAALYDYHHRSYRHDIHYYCQLARAATGPTLEFGCGSGRITIPMLQSGAIVHGVEKMPELLARLRTRLKNKSLTEIASRVQLYEADWSDLHLPQKFPLVLMPFNALMHAYDLPAIDAALGAAKRHLAPGGVFALDVLNPDVSYLAQSGQRSTEKRLLAPPGFARKVIRITENIYDEIAQINYAYHHYYTPAKAHAADRPLLTVLLKQRQFFPQELPPLLERNGLRVRAAYGDFAGTPLQGGARHIVLQCGHLEDAT